VEHGFGRLAVGISGEFSRTLHVWRTRDQNLYITGRRADGWPTFGRLNPAFYNFNVYESAGKASYAAMVLHATRRMSRDWALDTHFTWSKALDDVTDINSDYAAHNQLDTRSEWGLSPFHQKYRFVASGMFESPAKGKALADWKLSPVVIANSFRPFNVLTGTDNLGDGLTTTHRPLGLGRNTGVGPNYFSMDARLGRVFPFGSERRAHAELTLECFNILNRTNFQSVNNIVGNVSLSALPQPIRPTRAAPTTPLAYTSAHPPRQFQVAVKIGF
jgi:hypothetical protein